MGLFRMTYIRDERLRGQTFAAESPEQAAAYAHRFEKRTKLPVLTLKRIGDSKFGPTGRLRPRQHSLELTETVSV